VVQTVALRLRASWREIRVTLFCLERMRGRRRGALLRSRTTIRLREVPEGFNGADDAHPAIPGQFCGISDLPYPLLVPK